MSAQKYFQIKSPQNLPSKGQRYLKMTKEQQLQVRFLTLHSWHISTMTLFSVWWDPTEQVHTATSMTTKTHRELLAKAKHNWPALLLKAVASTFFLPMPQVVIISQFPNQSACAVLREIPTSSTCREAKENLLWPMPGVHGLIHFSSISVPPWRFVLCHCLRTAALFHPNVNVILQIWSAVPVSLLFLCYVTEM